MIVGTAGHIDHGKTSLVRALTGIDTDRLKEEKARGISIELGYAYVPVEEVAAEYEPVLGFVDVPGHERLVHTMVAGASGIDFALLVVAADDGVMPQTREHLAILDLLGVGVGAVALSKVDRVDSARVDAVAAEIAALLESGSLRGMPVFPLVATNPHDDGMAALRAHLHAMARRPALRSDDGLFRLAVDRVFTLIGRGTIVTGFVHGGSVHVGDALVAMPAGLPLRVRGIHAQNRTANSGHAGQRCALNITGIDRHALARGDWIADTRAFVPTQRIDARLQRSKGSAALPNWLPLHIHLGATHRLAHVVPLEDASGDDGAQRVQLVFDAPVCATPGDRFIARDARAMETIGGGRVLDPHAPARKRRSPQRHAWMGALERLIAGEGPTALIDAAPFGVGLDELARLCGCVPERLVLPPHAHVLESARGRIALAEPHWQGLREHVLAVLSVFHADAPDEVGVDAGRLRRIAMPTAPDALWRALVDELVRQHQVVRSGAWLHLPEHRIELSTMERTLADRVLPLLVASGFDPPWVRELALQTQASEDDVRRTLRKCVTQGSAYQVVHDLFYAAATMRELARVLRNLAGQHGAVQAAAYRDALGLGRKRTVQLLEFFDRVGYTRRVRDAHVLRADSGWDGS